MPRITVTLVLVSIFIILAMVLMDLDNLAASTPEKKASGSQTFVLPQKHTTSLTREEQRGQLSYVYYCALCHGNTGNADGFNSYNLSIPAAKHSDATVMATLSDSQIQQIIRDGGPSLGRSPLMPPWGGILKDKELSDITAFIRTLALPQESKEGH